MTNVKKTNKNRILNIVVLACIQLAYTACGIPALVSNSENLKMPGTFNNSLDTNNIAKIKWDEYFADPDLRSLIDLALRNNQELNITSQEILIAQNEIRIRKGEYLPAVGLRGGAGIEKMPRYTNIGAMESSTEILPGREMPEPLTDIMGGAFASWEVDIWHKLRNAKKAAVSRYLASVEGRNFMVTNLISEIANSYYELLALDNQLAIVHQNIILQNNAFEIVKIQKEAARVTELPVRRFQAEVLKTQSLQFEIQQRITETENRINFLVGRFPQEIQRNKQDFGDLSPKTIQAGIPAQLLTNRPDIKQAELNLSAAKLDVQVARARFYPSLGITAGIGYRAFNPGYLFRPESILYNLAGDLAAPLVNKNEIKGLYANANAKQIQSLYNYEQVILKANMEVVIELAKIYNLEKAYDLKSRQVATLTESVNISNNLFRSARADYMEVLLTQREALESKFELIETKVQQMKATVGIYRALGGGWNND